jgi:glycerophosphoryl diester phosphodiesterase
MHGRGLSVSTWTVDEPDVMERMAENRVDAIVSNRIGTLRRLLDAR